MKKLIYNGVELDLSKEQVIDSDDEFGFDVEVYYSDDPMYAPKYPDQVFHNFDEVHYLYDGLHKEDILQSDETMGWEANRIAFESDNFHRTGCNRGVGQVDTVIINKATKLHDKYTEFMENM